MLIGRHKLGIKTEPKTAVNNVGKGKAVTSKKSGQTKTKGKPTPNQPGKRHWITGNLIQFLEPLPTKIQKMT